MKHLKKFEDIYYPNKMVKIAQDELKSHKGGDIYFNKIDSVLKLTKNIDVIKEVFNQIKADNKNFNIVLTGGFGDWILSLIKKRILNVDGNVVMISGSLRGTNNKLGKISKGKDIEILYKKFDIENQEFILFDDSFYSGSTKDAIEKYLRKFNSNIVKTYVLYDGNDEKNPKIKSLYRYYDYHKGTIQKVDILLNYLDSLKLDIPQDILTKKILNKEIQTIMELNNEINKILHKFGKPNIDRLNHKEISKIIKTFENFAAIK